MALEHSQPQDVDLDRTDRLPILEGISVDADVEDDAVRMDYAPAVPSVKSEFTKAAGVAESVRSVEERMARRNAEYEALVRSCETARDAEAAASARAQVLAADLAALRVMLESERTRSSEIEKTLAEKNVAAQAMRTRAETSLREAERYQSEARTLRDSLAARDATIVQVLHSLGERDAQLNALQREHAHVVPALEERSKVGTLLEADLRAARARYEATAADLKNSQQTVAAVTARLKAGEEEMNSMRRELDAIKTQAASYLELLRTREWRRGFDQNLFLELDANLAARDGPIAKLRAAAVDDESQPRRDLHSEIDKERAELTALVQRLQSEAHARENELAGKSAALEQLNEDNRSLRAALERSQSHNANVPGRLQAGMERPVSADGIADNAAAAVECTAELIRIDGEHNTAHPLARRTRIGRAPGCEMQIESTSVSRHHALVLLTPRDAVIEDLKSTNGVIVNGRRISRQLLNDGDLVTIGEAQFRVSLKFGPRTPAAPAPAPE
jgi:chromosome segregation ATPase